MKSVSTTFNAVHTLRSARIVAMVAATLFAAATLVHPAAHAEDSSYVMFEEDYPGSTAIAESDAAAARLAELERAFWICDHAGTAYGVEGTMAVACVAVTDELRQLKFANDTELLTDWWRLNKAVQHASLEREITAARAYEGSADTVEFPDSI